VTRKSKQSHSKPAAKLRPGIALAKADMQQSVDDALTAIEDPATLRNAIFEAWVARIHDFSTLAKTATGLQSIAVIGSALIAKATNLGINPFCLRANASVSGAYNARAPAEHVLYPTSLLHRFDIGSNSSNPLNGQTFNKLKVIDKTLRIRGGQTLVDPLNEILHAVSLLASKTDAVLALAAYIQVRQGYVRTATMPTGHVGVISTAGLQAAVANWVTQDSEGGARAQAAVGGILDAIFGRSRVRVGKPNEPDRRIAGGVIPWKEQAMGVPDQLRKSEHIELAIEVRDKPVSVVDCLSVLRKLAAAGVSKGAIVAIGKNQPSIAREIVAPRAIESGVHLELYFDWATLIGHTSFWSQKSDEEIADAAVQAIRQRAEEMRVTALGIREWDLLTRTAV
jgi:hypothetical protein